MNNEAKKLPYFDAILSSLEDTDTAEMFADYMHWGYWDEPSKASVSPLEYAWASERLVEQFCQSLDIRDDLKILDVGSGFGGLARYLSKHYKNIVYVGVNIDQRQIDISNNRVDKARFASCEFVNCDAVKMPFPDGSFDRVLALESIFHFTSREMFLNEALRMLRSGGLIGCTDFVGTKGLLLCRYLLNIYAPGIEAKTWGPLNIIRANAYQKIESLLELERKVYRDITANVNPSYSSIRANVALNRSKEFRLINSLLELTAQMGLIRYHMYAWTSRG